MKLTISKSKKDKAAKTVLIPFHALSVLAEEMDFIQSEVYKNSSFVGKRNDRILYYDCINYYFEIEQEDGEKKNSKCRA